MATRFVSPAATGAGNGTSTASPWTVRQAGQNQNPGDIIKCMPGDYVGNIHKLDVSLAAVHSGTPASPIRWQVESSFPRFAETFRLDGVTDLQFETGLQWFTQTATGWVADRANLPMHRIKWTGVTFNSPGLNGGGAGILGHGNDYTFQSCTFGDKYPNDMTSFFNGLRIAFFDCDFSQARGGHSLWSTENCSQVVVKRCFLRNNIARGTLMLWSSGGPAQKILIDHCAFVDCDWNQQDFYPLTQADDGQAVRFSVERGIIRDTLFLHTNKNNTQSNNAALQFLLFNTKQRNRLCRIYHNTFYDSAKSAFALGRTNSATTWDANLNRFLNNVMYKWQNDGQSFAFKIGDDQVVDWKTWHVFANMMFNQGQPGVIRLQTEGSPTFTVAQAQSSFPNVFQRNLASQPVFQNEGFYVDPDLPAGTPFPYTLADLETFFTNYRLKSTSPGFSDGDHLAILTQGSTGNVLTVNDAISFYDGYGISGEVGDDLLIGSESVRVTSVLDDTHLQIDRSINAPSGTKIYLARTGRMPARGLMVSPGTGPGPDPPPPGGHGGHSRRASRRRVFYIPPVAQGR